MKKPFLILILLSISILDYGQITFQKTYGGPENDMGISLIQIPDGGYIIGGWTSSFGEGGADNYVIKTDEYGDTIWTKTFGSPWNEFGSSVIMNQNNEYIICGTLCIDSSDNSDFLLLSLNDNGETLWSRLYGGPYNELEPSIIETSDGGYLISGHDHAWDMVLIRTNTIGDTIWTCHKEYGNCLEPEQSILTYDNSFLTVSHTYLNFAYGIKTDDSGNTIWENWILVNSNPFMGNSITRAFENGYIIGGKYTDMGPEPIYFPVLVKINEEGSVNWYKIYDDFQSYSIRRSSVQMTSDNGYIFMCNAVDLLLIKTDIDGVKQWSQYFPGYIGCQVLQTNDLGYIIVGYTTDNDVCLIKTDEYGLINSNNESKLDNHIAIFPNPFDDIFTIENPGSEKIELSIYNSEGKLIKQKEYQDIKININLGHNKSGLYFLKIVAQDKTYTQKIIKK